MRILTVILLLLALACAHLAARDWNYINGPNGTYAYCGAHRSDGTVFLGTSGGLYVLDPGADTWRVMSNGLPHSWVASIAFGAPGVIVVAFEYPLALVYRSTNDGTTWQLIGDQQVLTRGLPSSFVPCRKALACDPESGDVAIGTTNGVYVLRNDSTEWDAISSLTATKDFYYVDRVLYFIGTYLLKYDAARGGSATDVGVVAAGTTMSTFAIAPDNAFVSFFWHPGGTSAMMRSTDRGLTWSDPSGALPDVVWWIAFVSADTIIAGHGINAPYRSNDGGASWIPANIAVDSGSTPIPLFAVAGPNIVVAYGGLAVSRSLDDGSSFHDVSDGLNARAARRIAGRIGGPLYIAYELGRLYRYNDTTGAFIAPDAKYVSLAVDDDATVYGVPLDGGAVYRSDDNGQRWAHVAGVPLFSNVDAIIAARGSVYVSTKTLTFPQVYHVWRTSNRGITWDSGVAVPTGPIYALAIDSLGYLYAGTDSATYRSTDTGRTFHLLNGSSHARALAVAPNNDVYAGWRGNVERLRDASTRWERAWTFPTNIDIKAIAVDTSGGVFVGSVRGGVSHSRDSGKTFTTTTDETVASGVWEFAIASNGTMYARTGTSGIVVYNPKPAEPEPPATERPLGIYPVPIVDHATIAFMLTSESPVRIDVHNVIGERVEILADRVFPAGRG
ncbi:MAG: hypothetical protein H7X80_02875, partial [bacterium]|nr:hypothetical protein [Candidatus Kapabacteria bacterium]